ncbi:hypothetical protein [Mycobacterium noviomagense]|uniref:Uncharacterized protein n=1 Tax=Mycobacterium noviomagense TaxID=459858 RepID=A0A7I7PK90_9MYCO|nr:hypothetical protein [Mycobacterium noviomagense]ORB15326.1 hypothetical protein BST37_08940 [Mycobacterium noviomagense]BBY08949.1 hypothetical protein MNVI_42670 [Mycobacterium noviomagense]
MTQFADTGPLAVSRRDEPARGSARAVGGGAAQSHDAAELAQARIFEGMLRSELSQLEQAARSMLDRGLKHRQRRASDDWPPEELVQLRARIDEAHRLLETLRRRFLHGPEGRDTR